MEFEFTDVNVAFEELVEFFDDQQDSPHITRASSRNGDVLMINEPVMVYYLNPRNRVLFNTARDANPFFHVFEALWMLAGRDDLAPLQYFVSTFDQFSDDGKTLNGAYGYRWRNGMVDDRNRHVAEWHSVDQIPRIIGHLREKPDSRRAVLQMWNVSDDLTKIDTSKDVCCNTNVYFSIRAIECPSCGCGPGFGGMQKDDCRICAGQDTKALDMTVCNRSNDLILGMLGANVVHFSFLQEYMAQALGVEVGIYTQFTNNLHVYDWNWKPEEWLKPEANNDCYAENKEDQTTNGGLLPTGFLLGAAGIEVFDEEVKKFIDDPYQNWKDPFLNTTARPMMQAFSHHKARQYDLAGEALKRIHAEDWRLAATSWIEKRRKNWEITGERNPYMASPNIG